MNTPLKRKPKLIVIAFVAAAINVILASVTLISPSVAARMPAQHQKTNRADQRRVIHISVDGLGSKWLTPLLASQPLPNFKRLQREGAWTLNARNDFDWTVTLPNHTAMLTGRPVNSKYDMPGSGHRWINNGGFVPGTTLHNNAGYYIASAFDVAHDNGLSTALYASKDKFYLYRDSYDAAHGAADITGTDNGRNKLDVYVNYDLDSTRMLSEFVVNMSSAPTDYSFVHFNDPDTAGHTYTWGSAQYITAVNTVDAKIGQIFALIDSSPVLSGSTWIVLSSDHGGTDYSHHIQTDPLNYTIPLMVWGPNIAQDTDLYALNPRTALNPAAARPDYGFNILQPLRNADTGNCALAILRLGTIPGSSLHALRAPCGSSPDSLQPIRTASTWRYRDTVSVPDPSWAIPSYDDSKWPSGMSALGYGDPVSTTLVSTGQCAEAPAAYFRNTFYLSRLSQLESATLNLYRDDGAVVYVNGIEVFRDNMPSGVIEHSTLASSSISNTDELLSVTANLPITAFVPGENSIAVEIHQASLCSSDLFFDAALTVRVAQQQQPPTNTPTPTATLTSSTPLPTITLSPVTPSPVTPSPVTPTPGSNTRAYLPGVSLSQP